MLLSLLNSLHWNRKIWNSSRVVLSIWTPAIITMSLGDLQRPGLSLMVDRLDLINQMDDSCRTSSIRITKHLLQTCQGPRPLFVFSMSNKFSLQLL